MEEAALLVTFAHGSAVERGNVRGESQRESVPHNRRPGPGRRRSIEITVLGDRSVVEASRTHRLEIFPGK